MGVWGRFFGLGEKIRIVEIQPELPLGDEARVAMQRLPEHPGFQYLMQRLRRQKGLIQMAMKTCPKEQLDRLQEALRWSEWLETTVSHEVKIIAAKRKEVFLNDRDKEVLDQSLANLEVIG